MLENNEQDFTTLAKLTISKYFSPDNSYIESLYHYTNNAGILGIIESSSLWATDSLYLNDSSEQEFGKKILLDEIRIRIDELKITQTKKDILNFMVNMAVTPKELAQRMYVISFCENGDLLSQWRGYAGSAGVSIGFNNAFFESAIKYQNYPQGDLEWGFYKVAYGKDAKDIAVELSMIVLSDLLDVYDNTPQLQNQDIKKPGIFISLEINSLAFCLEIFVTVTKHEGFSEENEWRLVGLERKIPKLNFRSSFKDLIPYIKFSFPTDFNESDTSSLEFETVTVDLSQDEDERGDFFGFFRDKSECDGPKYISEIIIGPTANFQRNSRAIEDLIKSTYYKKSLENREVEDKCLDTTEYYSKGAQDKEHLHQYRFNAFFDMPKITKSKTPLV
jgi:hypothetical protein